MPRTPASETALLSETRAFMRALAHVLEALARASRAVRRRLERTDSYHRVAGSDDAEREPMFDLAGTLREMLEDDLERMVAYLREAVRRTQGRR